MDAISAEVTASTCNTLIICSPPPTSKGAAAPPPPLLQWRSRGPESVPYPSGRSSSYSLSLSSTRVRPLHLFSCKHIAMCGALDDPICASVQAAPVVAGEGSVPSASFRAETAESPRARSCRRPGPPRPPPVPRFSPLSRFDKLHYKLF